MQIGSTILSKRSATRAVVVERNLNSHTGDVTFYGSVYYADEPALDFDVRLYSDNFERWFNCWSRLAEEG
jgi:hypothetical protein